MEAKPSTSLEETNRLIKKAGDLVAKLPSKYLDIYETNVGKMAEERGFDPNAKQGSNFAQITVYLTPSKKEIKLLKRLWIWCVQSLIRYLKS